MKKFFGGKIGKIRILVLFFLPAIILSTLYKDEILKRDLKLIAGEKNNSKEHLTKQPLYVFTVYKDKAHSENHYFPSGWLGDYDAIRREESNLNPHSGKTSIKFVYTAKTPQGAGWAGVYWQNPVNNWGEVNGGYNLSQVQKLTFWARGEEGVEVINRFGMGGLGGNFGDSATREIGPIKLAKNWTKYTISLEGLDLSYISGGFYWMTDKSSCPDGVVFYLDDIVYE